MDVRAAGRNLSPRRWARLSEEWLTDLGFLACVVALAAALRFIRLGNLPNGLHGDEAGTGLDARAILDGVDLWPYTPTALGQPSAPMYWAAIWNALLGSTVFSVRLPMALLGIGTVIFAFLALRELFGRATAYCGAVMLASSSWLLFYNRTGYSVSAMPFTEMASLYFVAVALRKGTWPWYLLAGAVVGAGIYGYFSYPLFAVALGIYVVLRAIVERPKPMVVHARNVAVMGLAALLLIQPMWPYLTSSDVGYRHDRDTFAVSHTPEYRAADSRSEKLDLYWENAQDLTMTLLKHGWHDFSDGSGTAPALDRLTIVLAGAGLGLCALLAIRRRRVAYLLPWIVIPIVLVGGLWTLGGYHRRNLGILPFVIMAAAVFLGYVWDEVNRRRPDAANVAGLAIAVVLLGNAAINIERYFDDISENEVMAGTYALQLVRAARYIDDVPDDTKVYFLSDRWGAGYETLRYLAPGRTIAAGNIEDRSSQFAVSGTPEGIEDIDRSKPVVIVLMGAYRGLAGEVQEQFPGAIGVESEGIGYNHPGPSFIAFEVPAE